MCDNVYPVFSSYATFNDIKGFKMKQKKNDYNLANKYLN